MNKISFKCTCGADHSLEVCGDTGIQCGCGFCIEYYFDPKTDNYAVNEGESYFNEEGDNDGNC